MGGGIGQFTDNIVGFSDGITEHANDNKVYTFVVDTVNSQSAETALLLFRNPSGSGKTIYVTRKFLYSASTSNWTKWRIYYNATITSNGTSVTTLNMKVGASNSTVALVTTLPTISANGTKFDYVTDAVSNAPGIYVRDYLNPYWILPENTNLLITGASKANNTPNVIKLVWFEL